MKKLTKTIIAIIAAVTFSGVALGQSGQMGTFTWELNNGTLTISGQGTMPDCGFVGAKATWYAHKNSVKNVIIGEGVESISQYAFYEYVNLTSVTFPSSLKTIENTAFSKTGLVFVQLPNSLTTVEYYAFSYCENLTSVDLPASLTEIGSYVFINSDNLQEVTVHWQNPPSGYPWETIIDKFVAQKCLLKVPAGTESAYQQADYWRGFMFEQPVVYNAPKTQISGTTIFWEITDDTLIISGTGDIPDMTAVVGQNFPWHEYRLNIKAIIIQEGITAIGKRSFYDFAPRLQSVQLPNSLTRIGSWAFSYASFPEIDIPNSVKTIEGSAFQASKLKSITIPNSVTEIEDFTFANSYELVSVQLPDGMTRIGSGCFQDCPKLATINFPNSLEKISNYSFSYCKSLASISLPNSITSIENNAFYFSGLVSIDIPNSVTTIAHYAFNYCDSLETVNISASVKSIGEKAFGYCGKLKTVTIAANGDLEIIGEGAFSGCKALASINLPNSLTTIGKNAFSDCTALSAITIPQSVQTIEERAFWGCWELNEVTVQWQIPLVLSDDNDEMFRMIPKTSVLIVPVGTTSAYKAAEVWKKFRIEEYGDTQEIPETVTINGVTWATRNVDAPGVFAKTPQDAGMLYQWNKKTAWNTTDEYVPGWDTSEPVGDVWEKANDPSPAGYRMPTPFEYASLLDETKVTNTWTTQNGVTGRLFIDKSTGEKLFLPTTNYRSSSSDGKIYDNTDGRYWSNLSQDVQSVYTMYISEYVTSWSFTYGSIDAQPVRSVKVIAPREVPESVVINGVTWATRNVDAPGTFAETPESEGKFYQWNRKTAYKTTGKYISDWDNSMPAGGAWEKANDPSPEGYRVPTAQEYASLFDESKVTNEWTTQNTVPGRLFTDIATGASLFFPAANNRFYDNGWYSNIVGTYGHYWSSTESELSENSAYTLHFYKNLATWNYTYLFTDGQSVRSVKDDAQSDLSSNANLQILTIEGLTPDFNANITNYTIVVPNSVTAVDGFCYTADPKATVNGEIGACKFGKNNLVVGKNTIEITVTAEDRVTKKTYTIIVDRKAPVETPETVTINGVTWATRNVDAPGTFAENPESAGKFYQWNRNISWSATDPLISSNGATMYDLTYPGGTEWEKANDPSPIGYRVPTKIEISKLFETTNVSNVWTTQNGVAGQLFTDKNTGATLFFPATGSRSNGDGGLYEVGTNGYYWSSTNDLGYDGIAIANILYFSSRFAGEHIAAHRDGCMLRCVVDVEDTNVYGCTDKNAINYNELATKDDKSCEYDQTDIPETVIINGVTWATRNVDVPGAFAETPESYGMMYQWNRKTAWSATEPAKNIPIDNWNTLPAEGTEWEKANDPSPVGYRVPTKEELASLLDETKVTHTWITQNGVSGQKFTDKATGNSIFLPAAGYRSWLNGQLSYPGEGGDYWSSTRSDDEEAYIIGFSAGGASLGDSFCNYAQSIRCVVDNTPIDNCLGKTPPAPTTYDAIMCKNATTIPTMRCTSLTAKWYAIKDDPASLIATGMTFQPTNITETTIFWVQDENDGCVSPMSMALIDVIPAPTMNIRNNVSFCANNEVKITVHDLTPAMAVPSSISWRLTKDGDTFTRPLATETNADGDYFVILNNSIVPSVGDYTLTAVYNAKGGSITCSSDPQVITVTMLDRPNPPIVASKPLENTKLENLQAFGSPNIQWIFKTGAQQLPNWLGNTYDFAKLAISSLAVGTYTFELFDIDAATGCESERVEFTFEVIPTIVPGCTDTEATNYNPLANQDDKSCIYPVKGCTDNTAENYNSLATKDDASCKYSVTVSVAASAGGTVSGGGVFTVNSTATVKAVAASGYKFVEWL
ncbi:MAG: leucine-rich repeat protein, partial [Bacteroidetes bacterium]|nr:leucine-rich repeat protein [Bacteroidota bacterium]